MCKPPLWFECYFRRSSWIHFSWGTQLFWQCDDSNDDNDDDDDDDDDDHDD